MRRKKRKKEPPAMEGRNISRKVFDSGSIKQIFLLEHPTETPSTLQPGLQPEKKMKFTMEETIINVNIIIMSTIKLLIGIFLANTGVGCLTSAYESQLCESKLKKLAPYIIALKLTGHHLL